MHPLITFLLISNRNNNATFFFIVLWGLDMMDISELGEDALVAAAARLSASLKVESTSW